MFHIPLFWALERLCWRLGKEKSRRRLVMGVVDCQREKPFPLLLELFPLLSSCELSLLVPCDFSLLLA